MRDACQSRNCCRSSLRGPLCPPPALRGAAGYRHSGGSAPRLALKSAVSTCWSHGAPQCSAPPDMCDHPRHRARHLRQPGQQPPQKLRDRPEPRGGPGSQVQGPWWRPGERPTRGRHCVLSAPPGRQASWARAAAASTQSGPRADPGDMGPGSVLLARGCNGHRGAKLGPDRIWLPAVVGWRSPWAQGQNQGLGDTSGPEGQGQRLAHPGQRGGLRFSRRAEMG